MLKALCRACPNRNPRCSLWLEHLLWLRTLLKGQCPLGIDDLELETWFDLGLLDHELNKGKLLG